MRTNLQINKQEDTRWYEALGEEQSDTVESLGLLEAGREGRSLVGGGS